MLIKKPFSSHLVANSKKLYVDVKDCGPAWDSIDHAIQLEPMDNCIHFFDWLLSMGQSPFLCMLHLYLLSTVLASSPSTVCNPTGHPNIWEEDSGVQSSLRTEMEGKLNVPYRH